MWCVCDCCICRVRSPSEQVTLEMRPQVNLGEQCCKEKELLDARLQGGKDLDMLTPEQRGLLLEHGIHRWRAGR